MSIYFCALDGNDSSISGSLSSPWRNPHVAVHRLSPGDSLLCRGGTYDTRINSMPSGTASNYITVGAYANETVWFKPTSGNYSRGVIGLEGSERYIEFDGINLDARLNQFGNCLGFVGGVSFLRYKNGEMIMGTTASYASIALFSPNNHLQNFSIHGGGPTGGGLPASTYGIYCSNNFNLIENFDIYDVNGGGIHVYNTAQNTHGNVIRNGVIRNLTRGGDTRLFGVLLNGFDHQCYNVVVYGLNLPTSTSGSVAAFVFGSSKLWNCVAADNPSVGCIGFKSDVGSSPEVRNCIAWNNHTGPTQGLAGAGVTNNSWQAPVNGADPLFVGGGNYRLTASSPCIDQGTTISQFSYDLEGGARPFGAAWDQGAYEYGSTPTGEPPPGPVFGSPGELGSGGSPTGSPGGSPQAGGGGIGVSIVTDFYSDHDMQCPPSWYGGFKEGRVQHFGDGERAFSNLFNGDWQGSTFDLVISDYDRKLRRQLASANNRYWTEALTIRMTTRANRANLGTPYTVFVGPIIDIKPQVKLLMGLTLGDIVSQGLLSDDHQIPWRSIRDGFLGELTLVSPALDLDTPEPTIYGEHRRVPDSPGDVPSPQGFQVIPTYLGTEFIGLAGSPGVFEQEVHVWMVAGHACKEFADVLVWNHDEEGGLESSISILADGDWYIPGVGGQPAYEDRRSGTYGNLRRYALIKAKIDNPEALGIVAGTFTLAVFVNGVETVGDGSGELITDRIQQYKHFLINYVVNKGPESYQSGNWLTTPSWDLFDGPVPIIEEASFDACSAIGVERLPLPVNFSPAPDYAAGYVGAAVIGARSSDRSSVRRWLSEWNRSCNVFFGITHLGQIRVAMLHPTEAIRAAAPLYTDAYEILEGSFDVEYRWQDKVNRVPWRADYEHSSGQWKTAGVLSIDTSVDLYGREIVGETREFPFAPGEAMASHLALMEARMRLHPPMVVRLEATIGPNPVTGESLGYLDLGSYVRYRHFASIAEPNVAERLGFVIRNQVQGGKRRVMIEVLDCQELIGFDAPIVYEAASFVNDTCDAAIVIPAGDLITNYTTYLQTSQHSTDPSIDTSVIDGTPAAAHHAAWFKYRPLIAQYGHITTGLSDYDTVLVVYRGSCVSRDLVASNDNDVFNTSFIEFSGALFFDPDYDYYIVAFGYNPDDAGNLVFTLYGEPLS